MTAGHIDHFESDEMTKLVRLMLLSLYPFFALTGCSVPCQAGTGTCGMSKEQADRLLHPKAYGEYWVKPEMTREGWRQDWTSCGGMPNGSYANDAPPGSSTAVIREASNRIAADFGACMQSKGYQYRGMSGRPIQTSTKLREEFRRPFLDDVVLSTVTDVGSAQDIVAPK